MNPFLRASALTCAALCLSFTLSTTAPAHADEPMVQEAQMRLASLGYYVGRFDGEMGPTTAGALIDFQRVNGLPVTGQLTTQTYAVLMNDSLLRHVAVYPDPYLYQHGLYETPYIRTSSIEPLEVSDNPVIWADRWHYSHTQQLPIRFGRLDVHEDDQGSVRHYAVTLNGRPVLFANNQPGLLRVSHTYAMAHEDAVIFTAYQADGVCAYKSYLLTIHSDGTSSNPKEVGNCGSSYEAHVADNALFLSFERTALGSAWGTWDVWRYENEALVRI